MMRVDCTLLDDHAKAAYLAEVKKGEAGGVAGGGRKVRVSGLCENRKTSRPIYFKPKMNSAIPKQCT